MTDRIVIFYGSKKDFEELVATETSKEQVTIPFMELIQHYNARLRPNESGVRESALSRNIDVMWLHSIMTLEPCLFTTHQEKLEIPYALPMVMI